jgi:3-deoxy-7-phosphoheptulonate synthase
MSTDWTPQDWKQKPIVQDVIYEDQAHVDRVLNKLQRLPPMVSASEVCDLVHLIEGHLPD